MATLCMVDAQSNSGYGCPDVSCCARERLTTEPLLPLDEGPLRHVVADSYGSVVQVRVERKQSAARRRIAKPEAYSRSTSYT